MLTTLSHEEYIKNLDGLNRPGSLICFRGDGCFTMYCNGKLIKTREELDKLQTNKNKTSNTFEVRFIPFNMLNIKGNIIKGNTKLAEEKLKLAGFKAVGTGASDGKITYSNGLGDLFVVDTQNKTATINGTTVDLGVTAQRVSGVDRSIWSSVNAPQQEVR